MSLSIYPYFKLTNDHKWRSHRAIARSNFAFDNHSCQKKTQNSWLSSNSTIVNPIPKAITSDTLKKGPDNVTVVAPEKTLRGEFWLRKWDSVDMAILSLLGMTHVLGACAPFVFSWDASMLTVGLGLVCGTGVTLGYHRLLTHHSLKVPKWLEYFFVYCGVHGFQKDPIFWVSVHKYHHMYADTERDPHTPSQGFWYSHMGWFLYNDYLAAKFGESRSGEYSNVPELKSQWFYRFLHETYFWHPIALSALLYLYGGFPYLAWGMGARGVLVYHFTFFVNSVTHIWGERPWNTPDTSTNNWWVAICTFGEGWHNNHHAFPYSARHGLEWWQFDFTWQVIKFLEFVGLATDIKLPTDADKRRKAKTNKLKTSKTKLARP